MGDFKAALTADFGPKTADHIIKAFHEVDVNKDNALSKDELVQFLDALYFATGTPQPSDEALRQQVVELFRKHDVSKDGKLQEDEIVDYLRKSHFAASLSPQKTRRKQRKSAADMGVAQALAAHNKLRKLHGAPPLKWSDECAEYAGNCAAENMKAGRMKHVELKTKEGKQMGQNIYWCSCPGSTEQMATQAWYDEIHDPGYDFDKPGFSMGTGHFTQVVWYDTTHVGMALSKCGCYIVANYWPPGNYQGRFPDNVKPPNTPLEFRPRNPKEKEIFAEFKKIDGMLKGGKMKPAELAAVFEKMGNKALAEAVRESGEDALDPKEFVSSMVDMADAASIKDVKRCVGFVNIDEDGNGSLGKEEFTRLLTDQHSTRQFSPELAEKLFAVADKNKDGKLDYEEVNGFLDGGELERQLRRISGKAPAGGGPGIEVDKWTPELEDKLASLPFKQMKDKLKAHLQAGNPAVVELTENSVSIKLILKGGSCTMKGRWG